MSDYIKREDAIDYLTTNMNWFDADGIETSEEEKRADITELVNGVSSADVEEVVRCKDCLWFEIAVMKADGTPDKRYKADWCGLHRIVRDGDDYCSDGWKDEEID